MRDDFATTCDVEHNRLRLQAGPPVDLVGRDGLVVGVAKEVPGEEAAVSLVRPVLAVVHVVALDPVVGPAELGVLLLRFFARARARQLQRWLRGQSRYKN